MGDLGFFLLAVALGALIGGFAVHVWYDAQSKEVTRK
jgi:hypothetical protein